jgi:hypothetical protein
VGWDRSLLIQSRRELIDHTAMSDQASSKIHFTPERFRREAARVRREAEETLDARVREQLFEIVRRFDAVAEMMERGRV